MQHPSGHTRIMDRIRMIKKREQEVAEVGEHRHLVLTQLTEAHWDAAKRRSIMEEVTGWLVNTQDHLVRITLFRC